MPFKATHELDWELREIEDAFSLRDYAYGQPPNAKLATEAIESAYDDLKKRVTPTPEAVTAMAALRDAVMAALNESDDREVRETIRAQIADVRSALNLCDTTPYARAIPRGGPDD